MLKINKNNLYSRVNTNLINLDKKSYTGVLLKKVILQKNTNLYGSHPFYMGIENGEAFGVFLLNSNAMGRLTSSLVILSQVLFDPHSV